MEKVSPPKTFFSPTRFAGLKPIQSILIISAILTLILLSIFYQGEQNNNKSSSNSSDASLHLSIVKRINAEGDYYSVAGSELRSRNYATRPFFNWRLPLLACFLGKLPSPVIGKWVLTTLTTITLLLWLQVLLDKGGIYMALIGTSLSIGPIVSSLTESAFVFHELWAGVLISFSIAIYNRNRALSVTSGLIALFIRELSLPFVIIMFFMAFKDKHKKEAAAWILGIFAFLIYLTIHANIVSGLITESDLANKSWVQIGGWHFVLNTVKWSIVTLFSPKWIDSILLPFAIFGLWGWQDKIGTRAALTVSAYVFIFMVVGRTDNDYWGLMYTPLISIGLIYAIPCLVDLYRTIMKTQNSSHPI
jgi:hypothetical protein